MEKAKTVERISYKEKVGYGLGDLACNMMFTLVSSYLMFFYTDIAGIGLAAVGSIMLVARIVDAVTDPLMGTIIDMTNTKWGKARPYVLWMAVPFAVISILMFVVPDIGANGKFIYALITYVLFCVVYTAVNIPYTTMMSNMTDSVSERLSFNMFKSLGANFGAFIATGVTLVMVGIIGGGNQKTGFVGTVAIYGVVGMVLLAVCFKNTKERIIPLVKKTSIITALKVAVKNKYWVIMCVICFFSFAGMIMRSQSMMYYAKYALHNEGIAGVILPISSIVAIPVAFVMPFVAKKIGKRNCVIFGNLVYIVGLICYYLSSQNMALIVASNLVSSLGSGVAMGVAFVMGAEVVDYSEWQTGQRPQGLMTAFQGFMVKLGMAAAGAIGAMVLGLGGYVENVEQTAASLTAISWNHFWLPLGAAVVVIVMALMYDLDHKYESVIADLHERRAAAGR